MARTAVCRACETRDELVDDFRKTENSDTHGVFFVVEEGTIDPAVAKAALDSWAGTIEAAQGRGRGGDGLMD